MSLPNNCSSQAITLNNGHKMPVLGLGTWKSEPGVVKNSVIAAIRNGYRHIDCAAVYRNEPEVGAALTQVLQTEKLVERSNLFITSKLWNSQHDNVREACLKTLKDLNLEYLDLYLVHWPLAFKNGGVNLSGGDPVWLKNDVGDDDENLVKIQLAKVPMYKTWAEMEKLVDEGLVKSIGVSNFNIQSILDLLSYARIAPAVNQIEVNPYLSQVELIHGAKVLGNIVTTAYSPFGSGYEGNPLNDATIAQIATKHDKSSAQVILRWTIQRGLIVIPKSVHEERIKQNAQVFDFELSAEEMAQIEQLNQNKRFIHLTNELGFNIYA